MSGTLPPAAVPETPPSRGPEWVEFFKRLISRKPNIEEVHLTSAGIVYWGDSSTDGSWRLMRSGNDMVFQRRESSVWTTKDTISA